MDGDEQRVRFLTLLRPIEGDLENYSRRMVFDQRDFEDALQNAVLRAFRAFDRYHDDASFRAWIFKILTNEIFPARARKCATRFCACPDRVAPRSRGTEGRRYEVRRSQKICPALSRLRAG